MTDYERQVLIKLQKIEVLLVHLPIASDAGVFECYERWEKRQQQEEWRNIYE